MYISIKDNFSHFLLLDDSGCALPKEMIPLKCWESKSAFINEALESWMSFTFKNYLFIC